MRQFEEEIINMENGGKIGKSGRFEPSKPKRQGLIITINQLYDLIEKLDNEFEWDGPCKYTDDNRKFQINIINKEGLSDTWEIESPTKPDKNNENN